MTTMTAWAKRWLRDNRQVLAFLLLLGVFRTAVADWNPIPSGSMRPTLLEGDVVYVNRLAYDARLPLTDVVVARIGEPRRGDVVTFFSPQNGTRLIKRIAGVPGDTVEMRGKHLFVNGRVAGYAGEHVAPEPLGDGRSTNALHVEEDIAGARHEIQWLSQRMPQDDFGPIAIPPDRYLVLGDNRDDSEDSRFFGLVPRDRLIGRAVRILASADVKGSWQPRFDRFGRRLD
jgi:signal peptidase I